MYMKIGNLNIEFRKSKTTQHIEQRAISIGPSTSVGLPYGGLSASLSAEASMKLSAVYRCVDVVSDSIATMPWDVMVYNSNKEWVKDEFHFSWNMLNIE